MVLDGIIPNQADISARKVKLPEFIPEDAVIPIRTLRDVDDFPRGAIAHLPEWDDDLAFDLAVAGATIILIDRKTHADMAGHEDFDPDGYGIIDDDGLWLPGLDFAFARDGDGWRAPEGKLEALAAAAKAEAEQE